MPREATVDIGKSGQQLSVRLSVASVDYGQDMFISQDLTLDPAAMPPLTSRGNVEDYGKSLVENLSRHHGVGAEIVQMFSTLANDRAGLDFVIAFPDAERFRWEALCMAQRFLAVDVECELRRILVNVVRHNLSLRLFSWPIRLVAFLSAAGITARAELEALAGAVAAARAAGLQVEMIAYLGEEDLLDEMRAAAVQRPGLEVRPIPAKAVDIEKAVMEDRPQILHFFCHGHSDADILILELASISDHDLGGGQPGSIALSIERLAKALSTTRSVWATVLNSCSGAREIPGVFSMTATLGKTGSPITVGMAEPIPDSEATFFASAFYPEVFQILAAALDNLPPDALATINLGVAVTRARQAMRARCETGAPDVFGRWCLPVLYQRNRPLRVAPTDHPEMQSRIERAAEYLYGLKAAPHPVRRTFLDQLDQAPSVPQGWRPDLDGNLP